jgi:hypothetical protein
MGPQLMNQWCGTVNGPAFSCIANRCVSECSASPGRVCTFNRATDCLECTPTGTACLVSQCSAQTINANIGSVDCKLGASAPFAPNDAVTATAAMGATCLMTLTRGGATIGQVIRGRQGGFQAWFIPSLGGWCVGQSLPTGAIRSLVSCPLCQFSVERF